MTLRNDANQMNLIARFSGHDMRPIAKLTLRIMPWFKCSIAFLCLALAIRLFRDSGPFVTVVGLALLVRFPCYLYLGFCEYRTMNDRRMSLALGGYLKEFQVTDAPRLRRRAAKPAESTVLLPA